MSPYGVRVVLFEDGVKLLDAEYDAFSEASHRAIRALRPYRQSDDWKVYPTVYAPQGISVHCTRTDGREAHLFLGDS